MNEKVFTITDCLTEERIIKYVSGELTGQELRETEEHLIDCPLCSDAVEGAEIIPVEKMREDFDYLRNELKINALIKRKKIIFYSAVAALLIIAGAALLNITQFAGPANKSLFNQYFEIYPDVTLHKRGEDSNNALSEAMNLYNRGKYKESVASFNKIIQADENETALFYKGVSLAALGKTGEALKYFNMINDSANDKFYSDAKWYASLCLVDLGKTGEANKLLSQLTGDPDYGEKASEILKKLHE